MGVVIVALSMAVPAKFPPFMERTLFAGSHKNVAPLAVFILILGVAPPWNHAPVPVL
jgi:hypothetical protein